MSTLPVIVHLSESVRLAVESRLADVEDIECTYRRARLEADLRDNLDFVGQFGTEVVRDFFEVGAIEAVTVANPFRRHDLINAVVAETASSADVMPGLVDRLGQRLGISLKPLWVPTLDELNRFIGALPFTTIEVPAGS